MVIRTAKSVIEFFSINAKFMEACIYGGIGERRIQMWIERQFVE